MLTFAAIPVFIEYVRHFDVSNLYWLLSSTLDVIGMFFICAAFVFEETRGEVTLGMIGSCLLLGSDSFAAFSAAEIGLDTASELGVVFLWFVSSCISASGCIFLGLCYWDFPCGPRLRLYFELCCLILFSYSAVLEVAYGFCPAGDGKERWSAKIFVLFF